ncbi:hypothetical protein VTO73DRAFT_5916 [Trametes versicolor]
MNPRNTKSLNTASNSRSSRLRLSQRRETLLGELLGVDRLINAAALIHQLPDEILAEAFLFSLTPNRFPWQLFQTEEQRFLVLLGVCVRWRSVICTQPRFWRDISVRKGHEWLTLALSRCAGAPANITLRDETLAPSVFSSVLPQHSRILRSIHATDISQSSMPRLLAFLYDSSTPTLHSLSIHNRHSNRREMRLSAESFPVLRQLTLNNFVLPAESSLYSQLHILVLTRCRWIIPMRQFLDILEATPRLTDLLLDHCDLPLFPKDADATSPLLSHTRIILPYLSTFKIAGESIHTTRSILAHVHAPSMANSTIQGITHEVELEGANLLVRLLPPDPWRAIPLLNTVTSITVRAERSSEFLGIWASGNGCNMSFTLPIPDRYTTSHWDPWLPHLFRDLIVLFSHAPITQLTVEGSHGDLTDDDWAGVFRSLPLVEDISVCGSGSHASLWDGLRKTSVGFLGPKYFKTDSSEGSQLDVSDDLFKSILDTLRSRARYGIRLTMLSLAFDHAHHGDYERYFKRYIEDLRTLVDNLEYVAIDIDPEFDTPEAFAAEKNNAEF